MLNRNIQLTSLFNPQYFNAPSLLVESIYQRHTFAQIHQKVKANKLLNYNEKKTVLQGFAFFQKSIQKSNLFKAICNQQPNLGFPATIPRSLKVQHILIQIIQNFSSICQTSQMNGYYLLKSIVRQQKLYTKFYQIKHGNNNFQVNQNFLNTFYHNQLHQERKFNHQGQIYLEILNQLITKYDIEWQAFLDILEIVCCESIQTKNLNRLQRYYLQRSQYNKNQKSKLTQKQKYQKKSPLKKSHLRFIDFLEQNILLSLFKSFKEFSLSQCKTNLGDDSTISNEIKRFFEIKKHLFFRISKIISGILSSSITQQMLMQKDYLPLIEVAQFIDNDIQAVNINNLIEPQYKELYNNCGINFILGLIPFWAFINTKNQKRSKFLNCYFKQHEKFNRKLSKGYKMQILSRLKELKTSALMPIKLWAKTQLQQALMEQTYQLNNIFKHNRMYERTEQIDRNIIDYNQKQIKLWSQYFQVNIKDINILQQKTWTYLLNTLILTLGIQPMLQEQFLKSILSYYTKKIVKNNANRFFTFWKQIIPFAKEIIYYQQQEQIINQQSNVNKDLVKLSKTVAFQLDLYVTGMILQQMLKGNHVDESLRILGSLLRDDNDDKKTNYSNELFLFVDSFKDTDLLIKQKQNSKSQLPQHHNSQSQSNLFIILKTNVNQLARYFRFTCIKFQTNFENKSEQKYYQTIDIEQKIKFICKFVRANVYSIQKIENKMFGDAMINIKNIHHLNEFSQIINQTCGLKVCIFLCLLLSSIKMQKNIKCIRYLIQTIDSLYTSQQTQSAMTFALSILFPKDSYISQLNRGKQIKYQNTLEKLLNLLLLQNTSFGEQKRQIKKLRQVISHHVNYLIHHFDSLDFSFPIKLKQLTSQQYNSKQSSQKMYEAIEKQLERWQFVTARQFMKQRKFPFRQTDWLFTLVKVLKLPSLLPVDIQTIIQLIKKVQKTEYLLDNYPIMQIIDTLNKASIIQQLLQTLKPTIVVQLQQFKVVNQLITNYQPQISYKQIPNTFRLYHKYEKEGNINLKNQYKALDDQCLLLKKICMFVRLIQQTLKLKLDPKYKNHTLFQKLQLVDKIYRLFKDSQQVHTYNIEYIHQQQTIKQTINIQSAVVSLLRLYDYQAIFPTQFVQKNLLLRDQKPLFILNYLEGLIDSQFSFQRKFQKFYDYEITSWEMYQCYENEVAALNDMFFYNVPFVSNDFGIEGFEASLKACVFSILQILCEFQKEDQLTAKCIMNFSHPKKCQNALIKYNPTLKYLMHGRLRSQMPLLFQYIKETLSNGNESHQYKDLQVKTRTIEALCVMMGKDLFYNEIIKILSNIRLGFVNLLTDNSIKKGDNLCPQPIQAIQVNIYNKIALFSYQLIKTTIDKHSDRLNEIINNYLITPSNLLKMLFQCMYSIRDKNINLENLLLKQTNQPFDNYLMQQRFTYLSLYRATLDILFRITLNTVEIVDKQNLYELIGMLLDFGYIVTEKTICLKSDNQLISSLKLQQLENVFINKDHIMNILLTEQITQYKYCYRLNPRKYGNNFMYSIYEAFNILLKRYKSLQENFQKKDYQSQRKVQKQYQQLINLTPKQFISKKIYYIKLINCFKSLEFSNYSMVKSYFQLMNLLTNIGPKGQNICNFQIDLKISKLYQKKVMANKYCLQNNFSFYQALNQVRKKQPGIKLVQKIEKIVLKMLIYVSNKSRIGNQQQIKQVDPLRQIDLRPIFSTLSSFKQLIPCINPNQVVIYISNLLSTAVNYYCNENSIKFSQSALNLKVSVQNFFRDLKSKSIKCKFSVLLIAYDKILKMNDKLNQLQIERFRGGYVMAKIDQKSKQNQSYYFSDLKRKQILILRQKQILQQLRQIFYEYLQSQKPTKILKQHQLFNSADELHQMLTKKKKCFYDFSKVQVMENVALICGLLTNALESMLQDNQQMQFHEQEKMTPLLTNQLQQQRNIFESIYYDFTLLINYLLKLMIDSINYINNPLSRIILFNLCNKFYFKHQKTTSVQKWPFYKVQKKITDQLIKGCDQKKNKKSQLDQFNDNNIDKLERINALDTYCTLAIVNQQIFTKELLTTLVNVVQIDENISTALKSQSQYNSKNQQDHMNIQKEIISRNRKRYNLRKSCNNSFTIDTLIEYKKLMLNILLSFTQQNWKLQSNKSNSLFLQILNFSAIEFSLMRLSPTRSVEKRLKEFVITQKQEQSVCGQMITQSEDYRFNRNTQSKSLIKLFKQNKEYSEQNQSDLSLFQFIGFVHHNQLIYNWYLAVISGLKHSSVMQEFGLILQKQVYNKVWLNIMNKIKQLFHYYTHYLKLFFSNSTFTDNITKLYNYIAQQSTYMNEFQGLTLYFDPLEEDYVKIQLIRSIMQYCVMVMQTVRKCRIVEWKCKKKWSQERLVSLKNCFKLINNKTFTLQFRKLEIEILQKQYNNLYEGINEEIKNERNFNNN